MNFWKDKRVFITGHTGFKGSWLTFWLNSLGANVCGYSLEPEGNPNLFDSLELRSNCESVAGDICNLELLKTSIENFRPQIVFHLAAQSLVRRSYREPVATYQTNLMGTVNVLESIRYCDSVKAAVMITTDKVYENKEWHWSYRENERLGGFDPYSNSKACAELAVAAYRNSFFGEGGTLIASARAGNVIGGGDWCEDRLIPDIFRSLVFGKHLHIRNPHSIRPWQFVLEPLSGYMALAEGLFSGNRELADAWNFGPRDEDTQSVGWILNEIKNIWQGDVNWEIDDAPQPHEARLLKLDSSKAKSDLGWTPKLSLKEGLRLTTDWYQGFKTGVKLGELTQNQLSQYQG